MSTVPMTPAESIANFILPNGRKIGLVPFEQNPNLFEIKYVEETSGELPDMFKHQYFTKKTLAEEWTRRQITKLWDNAMKHAPKAKVA